MFVYAASAAAAAAAADAATLKFIFQDVANNLFQCDSNIQIFEYFPIKVFVHIIFILILPTPVFTLLQVQFA